MENNELSVVLPIKSSEMKETSESLKAIKIFMKIIKQLENIFPSKPATIP